MTFVFVPNFHVRFDRSWVAPYVPLELLLGVASAEAAGARCAVYDPNAQVHSGCLSISPQIWQRAAERIVELRPGAVFFETWTETLHNTVQLAEALRVCAPELPLVLFGAGSSAVALELLQAFPSIDGVIRGELEPALVALARSWPDALAQEATPGLCWRGAGGIRIGDAAWVEDLDALPRAAYHHSLLSSGDSIPVESGRGCAQGCSFCALAGHWPGQYRHRAPESLAEEMLSLSERYPLSPLDLTQDPVFFADPSRLRALCSALGDSRAVDRRVRFSCHARIDQLERADIVRLAHAGCQSVLFGVESGSPRVQAAIGKRVDLERALPTARAVRDAGIDVHATFILGFPGETEDDLVQTRELALALGALGATVEVHLLRAYPGSPLHQSAPRYRYCPPIATAAADDARSRALIERHPALFPASYLVEVDLDAPLVFGNWLALSSFAEVLVALSPVASLAPGQLALSAPTGGSRPRQPRGVAAETLEQAVAELALKLRDAVPADALLDRQTLEDALRLQVALFTLARAAPPEPFDVDTSLASLQKDPANAVLAPAAPWQLIAIDTDLDLLMDERLSLVPTTHQPGCGLLAKVAQQGAAAHYTQQAAMIESFALDAFGAEAFRLFRGEATLEAIAHTVAASQHVPPAQALEECLELAIVLCEAGVLRAL